MIRIGFDPVLDAQLQHKDAIREIELLRLAKEGTNEYQTRVHSGSRILVLIGKQMAIIGTALQIRYGNNPDSQGDPISLTNPGECTS